MHKPELDQRLIEIKMLLLTYLEGNQTVKDKLLQEFSQHPNVFAIAVDYMTEGNPNNWLKCYQLIANDKPDHPIVKHMSTTHVQKQLQKTRNPDEIANLVQDVFNYKIAAEIFGTDTKFNGNARLVLMTGALTKINEPSLTLFVNHFGLDQQKTIAMKFYHGVLIEEVTSYQKAMTLLETVKKNLEEHKPEDIEVKFYSSSLLQQVNETIKLAVLNAKLLKAEFEILLKNANTKPNAIVQKENFYRKLMQDARMIALNDYGSLLELLNKCFSAVGLTPIPNNKKEPSLGARLFGFLTADYRPIELSDVGGPSGLEIDLAPPERQEFTS